MDVVETRKEPTDYIHPSAEEKYAKTFSFHVQNSFHGIIVLRMDGYLPARLLNWIQRYIKITISPSPQDPTAPQWARES